MLKTNVGLIRNCSIKVFKLCKRMHYHVIQQVILLWAGRKREQEGEKEIQENVLLNIEPTD